MLVTLHVRYIYLLFPYILTQVWSAMQLIFFPKKISITYSASETNFSFPWILRHITLNLVCYDDSTITSYCSENLAVQITAATLSCRSQQLNRWMRYFLFKNNECRHLGSTLSPSPTSWPSWGWSSTWARQSRASVSSIQLIVWKQVLWMTASCLNTMQIREERREKKMEALLTAGSNRQ